MARSARGGRDAIGVESQVGSIVPSEAFHEHLGGERTPAGCAHLDASRLVDLVAEGCDLRASVGRDLPDVEGGSWSVWLDGARISSSFLVVSWFVAYRRRARCNSPRRQHLARRELLVPIGGLQRSDPGMSVFLVVFKIWRRKTPVLEAAHDYTVEAGVAPDSPIDGRTAAPAKSVIDNARIILGVIEDARIASARYDLILEEPSGDLEGASSTPLAVVAVAPYDALRLSLK